MTIYELKFIPEVLYGAAYRKSLTALFPRFLKAMAKYHEADIRRYLQDAFRFDGSVEDSVGRMTDLFTELGVGMYFDGKADAAEIAEIDISTALSAEEVTGIIQACLR